TVRSIWPQARSMSSGVNENRSNQYRAQCGLGNRNADSGVGGVLHQNCRRKSASYNAIGRRLLLRSARIGDSWRRHVLPVRGGGSSLLQTSPESDTASLQSSTRKRRQP